MTDVDDTTDELLDDEPDGDVLTHDSDLDEELFEAATSDDAIFDDEDADEDEPAVEDDDQDEDEETVIPLDASEDGDDELDGQPAVDLAAIEGLDVDDPVELAEEEAVQDEDDTIREGEFVCRSCHMAKRPSALADADEMLCRDCV
jgi:hypothetical protein